MGQGQPHLLARTTASLRHRLFESRVPQPVPVHVTMGLKLLVAARDGVIDNREIDAILDNLNAVYDVVLVASTLLFAGLFGFFFSSPPTPDEWLSEDLVDKLQWAFLVLNGISDCCSFRLGSGRTSLGLDVLFLIFEIYSHDSFQRRFFFRDGRSLPHFLGRGCGGSSGGTPPKSLGLRSPRIHS